MKIKPYHVCSYCQEGIVNEVYYSDWRNVGNGTLLFVDDLVVGLCDYCHNESVSEEMHDYNLCLIMTTPYYD
jgi:hypothetical protein